MTQPDPNAQSGVGSAQSGTDAGTSTGTTGDGTGTGAQSGDTTGQTTGTQATSTSGMTLEQALAELENQRRRTAAADQTSSRTAAELKKLQDAQLSEQDRIKKENEELKAQNAKAAEELKNSRIRQAFLEDSTYKWKNPSTALRVVDLANVKVNDDGKVEGLKAALDALAKSDPYLVETTEGENTATTGTGTGAGAATGGATGVAGNNGSTNAGSNKAQQAARFPAMRTRGING